VAPLAARVRSLRELVDHHTLEDIRLLQLAPALHIWQMRGEVGGSAHLIINKMKNKLPKRIKNSRRDEEPANAHPEAVREGD
jgi:hypothetical protein